MTVDVKFIATCGSGSNAIWSSYRDRKIRIWDPIHIESVLEKESRKESEEQEKNTTKKDKDSILMQYSLNSPSRGCIADSDEKGSTSSSSGNLGKEWGWDTAEEKEELKSSSPSVKKNREMDEVERRIIQSLSSVTLETDDTELDVCYDESGSDSDQDMDSIIFERELLKELCEDMKEGKPQLHSKKEEEKDNISTSSSSSSESPSQQVTRKTLQLSAASVEVTTSRGSRRGQKGEERSPRNSSFEEAATQRKWDRHKSPSASPAGSISPPRAVSPSLMSSSPGRRSTQSSPSPPSSPSSIRSSAERKDSGLIDRDGKRWQTARPVTNSMDGSFN